MGDKGPLHFEETGLFSAFSTRWHHTGVNLPSASEPEAQEQQEPGPDRLTLLVQGLPCPHSAVLSHCPGSPPHPFTRGKKTFALPSQPRHPSTGLVWR